MKYYGSTKSIMPLRLLASIIRPTKYSKVTPDDKYTIKNNLSNASAAHSDPSAYSLFYYFVSLSPLDNDGFPLEKANSNSEYS